MIRSDDFPGPRLRCKFGAALDALSEPEQAILMDALANPGVSTRQIVAVIQREGIEVCRTTADDHRAARCLCAKVEK